MHVQQNYWEKPVCDMMIDDLLDVPIFERS